MNLKACVRQLWLTTVTSSYLKPTQIANRIRMLVYLKVLHRSKRYRTAYLNKATGDEPFTPLNFPYIRPATADVADIVLGRFTFLNRAVDLGVPTDWVPASETRLWVYNLHYFDYLRTIVRHHRNDSDAGMYALFRRLVSEWIDSCEIARPLAWDAYPMSLRLNNWLRAYSVFQPELEVDSAFARKLRQSIYIQAAFLEKHLEYHLLNNHLLENGRTLWLAGNFFADANADRWMTTGRSILWRGLEENFLSDGGHDERSPMYHQIMLDMYQEVADVMVARDESVPDELSAGLVGMRHWLATVLHPDGNVSLFNDSAMGIAGDPADLIETTPPKKDGLIALSDSGYFVFRDAAKNAFLMFDCGPMGPDHRNQHGHCDALSFELSIGGRRIIVDSGVSDYYGDLEWRNYYRGTRAHNTVVVDETEQSEIWDRFRVARRARPKDVVWSDTDQLTYVCAAHTGYSRLPGKVIHRRWVCYVDKRFWVVCDCIEGAGDHVIESLLHFHPEVSVSAVPTQATHGQTGRVTLSDTILGDTTLGVFAWGHQDTVQYKGQRAPLQGWYAAEFGLNKSNTVWGFTQQSQLPHWSGFVLWPEESNPVVEFSDADRAPSLHIRAENCSYSLCLESSDVVLETGR